jgi:hypothetical protein
MKIIWRCIPVIKVPISISKQVHTGLISKYTLHFHFYFSKPISAVVYNDTKSNSTNIIKDAISLSDDTEFLNRMYHYYNSSGKE